MAEKKSFVVNDESVNSNGFRMMSSGMRSDRFLKNPVMLDGHERNNSKVLGAWENLRTEGTVILADPIWDDEDAHAKNIHRKVDKGFIKGCSLSAEPIRTRYNEVDDLIEVVEWELKEISIACVPSNANSLLLTDKKGNQLNKEQLIALSENSQNPNLDTMKNLKLMAKVVNLTDTATEDEVMQKVQEIADANIELTDANATLTKANEKLKKEVGALKDAQKDVAKNLAIALVDGAVSANKILPAEREDYLELAEANYESTKKVLDKKKPFKGISVALTEGANADEANAFAEETKGWKYDEFFKKGRLTELMDKDADRYKEVYKAKFNKEPKQ
jgi:phage head maturation protease